ncbi:MAG: hypothetical protein AAGH15_10885 [Myxococcota bacterium]
MQLPNRIRAHQEAAPEVYSFRFDGVDLFYCVVHDAHIISPPLAPFIDHWFLSGAPAPNIVTAALQASTLEIHAIGGGNVPAVANQLHAAFGNPHYQSPEKVPVGAWTPGTLPIRQFVSTAGPFFNGQINELAITVWLNAAGDMRVHWTIDEKVPPADVVFTGPTGVQFTAVNPGTAPHPDTWQDAKQYVAP